MAKSEKRSKGEKLMDKIASWLKNCGSILIFVIIVLAIVVIWGNTFENCMTTAVSLITIAVIIITVIICSTVIWCKNLEIEKDIKIHETKCEDAKQSEKKYQEHATHEENTNRIWIWLR